MMPRIETAVFGNLNGSHQLLESTLTPTESVINVLRFLVDRPAGHVGPEVCWTPYWGCQAIGGWWAMWRGEEDVNAPRRNMVRARVALLPLQDCGCLDNLDLLFAAIGEEPPIITPSDLITGGEITDRLASSEGLAAVPEVASAPAIMQLLWSRLWNAMRKSLSLRTVFGPEGSDSSAADTVLVFPPEMKPRWYGRSLVERSRPLGAAGLWLTGNGSERVTRLIEGNIDRLPNQYEVLNRVARIAERLDVLASGAGTPADALLVIRTQEAFSSGLELPPADINSLLHALCGLNNACVADIRSASLAKLDALPKTSSVEKAVSEWVEGSLIKQTTKESVWILENAAGTRHAQWWKRAVSIGLDRACKRRSLDWSKAIWQWWQNEPATVALIAPAIDRSASSESWLCSAVPVNVSNALLLKLEELCREREWAELFCRSLGSKRDLAVCVQRMRETITRPEAVLETMVAHRTPIEVVDAACTSLWPPLLDRAIEHTLANPWLLCRLDKRSGTIELLARHLRAGGSFPRELRREDFLNTIIAGAVNNNADKNCIEILRRLGESLGPLFLRHPDADKIFALNDELAHGAASEWWKLFLSGEYSSRPPSRLVALVLRDVQVHAARQPAAMVISLLRIIPEISERDFITLLTSTTFNWEADDSGRLASVLLERQWKSAAKDFRWSPKQELKLIAWEAKSLLSSHDRFWLAPTGSDRRNAKERKLTNESRMKILFLAANPSTTGRLALDEEAREIMQKVRDSRLRELVEVQTQWAVRPGDLQQSLLEHEPTVVHFSGHGSGEAGIVLSANNAVEAHPVGGDALSGLFRVLKNGIKVVVLNACFSEVQARAIVKEIDFVVGMSDSIGDEAARVFSAAFYRALSFGLTVRAAFNLGINELQLCGIEQQDTIPQLLVREGANEDMALVISAKPF